MAAGLGRTGTSVYRYVAGKALGEGGMSMEGDIEYRGNKNRRIGWDWR